MRVAVGRGEGNSGPSCMSRRGQRFKWSEMNGNLSRPYFTNPKNRTLKNMLENWQNTGKVRENWGKFVSQKKWEQWILIVGTVTWGFTKLLALHFPPNFEIATWKKKNKKKKFLPFVPWVSCYIYLTLVKLMKFPLSICTSWENTKIQDSDKI